MQENIVEALQSLIVPIDSIRPDPANAREGHDLDGIAGSLAKFGQRKPIVVNAKTGIIEAGNGTYQAARVMGWEKIAAVRVEDDSVTQASYSIADNRLSDKSHFNNETLAALLASFDEPTREIPGVDEEWLSGVLESVGVNNSDTELPESPEDFKEYDEEIETQYCCPKCGYEWSGKPK